MYDCGYFLVYRYFFGDFLCSGYYAFYTITAVATIKYMVAYFISSVIICSTDIAHGFCFFDILRPRHYRFRPRLHGFGLGYGVMVYSRILRYPVVGMAGAATA